MTLVKIVTFVVLKVLNNLVSMQNSLYDVHNPDVNKISKTVHHSLTFILNVLSESSIHFYLAFNSSC